MRYIVIFLTAMVLMIANAFAAPDETINTCNQVVIAGSADWVPYLVINHDGFNGVGVELAEKVFKQLDIPVKSIAFDNHLEMLQALRTGDIDLLISTYNHNDFGETIELVKPAYIDDPVTIAVKTKNAPDVIDWEALTGHHGVVDMTFTPDQETAEFFQAYLSLRDKLTLGKALDAVVDGDAYYIVGSRNQLLYAIQLNNLNNFLVIPPGVEKAGPVYMAFRKSSPCHQYASFLTKRLQEYKNDGTVDKLLNSYILSR